MNDKQRYVAIGSGVAIVLALLFPPFHFRLPNGMVANMGYGWLFSPPEYSADRAGSVTVEMLLMEWIAIAAVASILWWLFKDRPPR